MKNVIWLQPLWWDAVAVAVSVASSEVVIIRLCVSSSGCVGVGDVLFQCCGIVLLQSLFEVQMGQNGVSCCCCWDGVKIIEWCCANDVVLPLLGMLLPIAWITSCSWLMFIRSPENNSTKLKLNNSHIRFLQNNWYCLMNSSVICNFYGRAISQGKFFCIISCHSIVFTPLGHRFLLATLVQ